MRTTDGRPLCELDVAAAVPSAWQGVTLLCASAADHVSTLAVESTGVADLDVGSLVLSWHTDH